MNCTKQFLHRSLVRSLELLHILILIRTVQPFRLHSLDQRHNRIHRVQPSRLHRMDQTRMYRSKN